MTGKNKVVVRIAGKDYSLVGTESDEYLHKVGLYIDRKMNEILKANSKLSTSMAAVLTSLNVADDYFKAHEEESLLKKDVKRLQEELDKYRNEAERLSEENKMLAARNTSLQLELAKREAELTEVRNSIEKFTKPRV